MKKIELLAPAKNLEYGVEAINCGADAVYCGATHFGARVNASNSLEDIKKLVEHAHLFGAKVYVTVNTVLDDEQIGEVESLIKKLHDISVDAIIIQDMGILELDLPPIPIHASTQCFINSLEKLKFIESMGIQRVIMPRETSLSKMKNFSENSDIELEGFIHGSLCVGYSGQCYLSYSIGKRSGNKGNCAQPCRKKYSIVDADGKTIVQDKYLLSLKDLNLSKYIDEMIEAGVSSFKIEGRLKDLAYLKNVVSFYRKEIDKVLVGKNLIRSSVGTSGVGFSPDLHKTFNRSYTDYCINNKPSDILSMDTPKSLGEPLSKVKFVKDGGFVLEHKTEISTGDGLCFLDSKGELKGFVVNKINGGRVFSDNLKGLRAGDKLYRNYNILFNKKIESSIAQRKISVKCDVCVCENEITVKYIDETGVSASESVKNDFEAANNKEKAKTNMKKQFSKSGDTVFFVEGVELVFDGTDSIPFVPVGQLNEIRRRLLESLKEKRISGYEKEFAQIRTQGINYPEAELDYRANIANALSGKFYARHGVESLAYTAEAGESLDDKVVMSTKLCLRRELGMCKKGKNESTWYLVDEKGKRFELCFDCETCEMHLVNI